MSLRPVPGWQFVLADLSLILFLTTAAALSQEGDTGAGSAAGASPPSIPDAGMTALYVVQPGAPSFADWLNSAARDPRERLTISAQYIAGERAAQARDALELVSLAERSGFAARLVLTPSMESRIAASFAFDGTDFRPDIAGGNRAGNDMVAR